MTNSVVTRSCLQITHEKSAIPGTGQSRKNGPSLSLVGNRKTSSEAPWVTLPLISNVEMHLNQWAMTKTNYTPLTPPPNFQNDSETTNLKPHYDHSNPCLFIYPNSSQFQIIAMSQQRPEEVSDLDILQSENNHLTSCPLPFLSIMA